MVYTIGLILLSGYSTIFRTSASVGILSFAYLLPLDNPRVIFFQFIDKSYISQNNFIALR
jgi:hypothetical protein